MRLPEEVVALDLSGPARGCGKGIDGLIGADFFRGKVVRIDYARRVLSYEGRLADGGGMRLRFENGVICVPVAIDGGRARWTRLDTGCTDALQWCEGACGGVSGRQRSVALAAATGCGRRAEVVVGTERTVRIEQVPVRMRGKEIFPGEAGLLGNGVLSRFCVTIDGIGNRLKLE
jgi:hypothetical protein